jgi:hypothetical protein
MPGNMIVLYALLLICVGVAPQRASPPAPAGPLPDTLPDTTFPEAALPRSFPDLALQTSGDTLFVAYSRSRYRPGAEASLRLLDALAQYKLPGIRTCLVFVREDDITQYIYTVPVREGHLHPAEATYAIGQAIRTPRSLRQQTGRTANYHLEVSLDLLPRFAFGANPDPVQSQLNLLPGMALRLWPGSRLHVQYALPLWNELNIPEESRVRPWLLTFSQTAQPAPGLFLRATAGYFRGYRYGGQLQTGYLALRGRLFLGASLGRTGYAAFPRRLNAAEGVQPGWEYSPIGYTDYLLTAGWRWDRYHLQILASTGKALLHQHIHAFSINRQFRQTNVRGFVQQIDDQWNYGIALMLPIPFARYFAGKRLTLQTGPFLDFRYNGTQHYAAEYLTGYAFPNLYGNLHPGMIHDLLPIHNLNP